MLVDAICVLMGFMTGSVLFGVVIGRLTKGRDPRDRDNPGTSGSYRQFGAAAGIAVGILDCAKGALAVTIAHRLRASQTATALAAAASVAGHNWPIWFGFSGGGGLATSIGALGSLAPKETLLAVAAGLGFALAYRLSPIYGRFALYPLPAGALAAYPAMLWLTARSKNQAALMATTLTLLIVAIRGLQMLRRDSTLPRSSR